LPIGGDAPVTSAGRADATALSTALANFNSLSKREGVVIESEYYAEEYLKEFLRLYYPHSGAYLPTRETADHIAGLHAYGEESEALRKAFKQVTMPIVEMVRSGGGPYRAQAYTWEWWIAEIERIDLAVSRDGVVTVSMQRHADQN